MPDEMKNICLEDTRERLEDFFDSFPSASRPYLISATSECLRLHLPVNEAEILGRCRSIRYAERARRR